MTAITEDELSAELDRFCNKHEEQPFPNSLSVDEIAKSMGRHPRTVRDWIKREIESGNLVKIYKYIGNRKIATYLPKGKSSWVG